MAMVSTPDRAGTGKLMQPTNAGHTRAAHKNAPMRGTT